MTASHHPVLITQCLQADFARPLLRHEAPPNKLHIGRDEARRLLGPEPDRGPLAQLMHSARRQPTAALDILHIRDWHDAADAAQAAHLEQFGPHCLRGTPGARLLLDLDDGVAKRANEHYVDALTLNDFEGTRLADELDRIRAEHPGAELRIGVIGVWTDAKVSFLCYDLLTRCGITELGTCSALTASNRRSQHFNALEQLQRLLGVRVFESLGGFGDWLLPGRETIVIPPPRRGYGPDIALSDGAAVSEADRDLIGYLYRDAGRVILAPMGGGFSGAGVFRVRSFDHEGHEHAPTVLKIGDRDTIAKERIALERVEAVLGNDAPTLRAASEFGGRSGLVFAFAAMGNTSVQTFKDLYERGAGDDEVQRILSMVFDGILGRFTRVARAQSVQHAAHWGFAPRFAESVGRNVASVYGADDERLVFPGGYEVPNPARFYADPLPAILEQPATHTLTSWVHGDLNGANILVDGRGNVWLIDFTHAERRHAITDLAKLENDILYIMTPVEDDDALAEALLLTRALRRVQDLAAPLPVTVAGVSRPEMRRAWRTLRMLRGHIAGICRDDRDPLRLAWALLRYAAHTLTFDESDALQKRWALAAAGGWAEDIAASFRNNRRLRIDRVLVDDLRFGEAPLRGRMGLTICPGRVDRGRSLEADVAVLAEEGIRRVLCLLTAPEQARLGVEDLVATCARAGIEALVSPVPDQGVPGAEQAERLVREVLRWLVAGDDVLIHCMGGLGRSGTIAGCVMKACGLDGAEAIARVRHARGPRAVEVLAQERFVHAFEPFA